MLLVRANSTKKIEKRTQQSQVDDTGRVTASLVQLEWLNTSNLVTSTKRIQKDTLLWNLTFTLRKNNENFQKERTTLVSKCTTNCSGQVGC
jgi:hypothetical protein